MVARFRVALCDFNASTQGGYSSVTLALLESATGLQHCSGDPAHDAQRESSPAASPVLPSPTSPCSSHFREQRLLYAQTLLYSHALSCHALQRVQEVPKQDCSIVLAS